MVGASLLVVGGIGAAVFASSARDDDEAPYEPVPVPSGTGQAPPRRVPSDPDPPAPGGTAQVPPTPTPGPSTTSIPGAKRTRALGWIPPEATEATESEALTADPEGDPLCNQPDSPLQIGKILAISLEAHMREATKVSDAEESAIGRRLEKAFPRDRSMAGRWDLPEDVQKFGGYVNDLVKHLAQGRSRAGIDYRVHTVRRPEFNAAALPGGVLMVYTGLLEGPNAVRDEAELVAVLGHEIAHVEKRHTIAAYQYAKAILGEDEDAQVAMKILTTPLSSEYEMEADEGGLDLAVKGQYDPMAAVTLWKRHAKNDRSGPSDLLEALLRSHPRPARRACHAMKRVLVARDTAPWHRLYDGKTNLQTRIMGPKKTY